MTDLVLGRLSWQPLADHPELVADAVAAASLPGDVWVTPVDPDLADTAAFCEEYGVTLEQSANCVIVEARRGDQRTLAACMVLATDRADINKTVRKHLDARKISFASMDEATSASGMEFGGITPIGLPQDWPILVDARVAAAGTVVIGGGVRSSKIALDGALLGGLPGAEVIELAQP
ncbi:YbaK/EbsC family protein [Luteipulveratus mongoliensis]|uniref:Prolyl-tRNA synthetase n=1 Tax=Luteipulveratus mongoliensis TaxID=571913 RepID=A0A0K1JHE8_9MICO|nr:YbaK/EbsC family protein [Luteipulveratus mongoliensis]AKU16013.1 prolyl-tRNA synthetase [Luteipulveratus mongoliensis]